MPVAIGTLNCIFISPQLFRCMFILITFRIRCYGKFFCRNTNFPDAVILFHHGAGGLVPLTKLTHQGNLLCIGSPYSKVPIRFSVLLYGVCTEHFISPSVSTLMEAFSDFPCRSDITHGCTHFQIHGSIHPLKGFSFMLIVYDFMHFRQGSYGNLAKTFQKTNLFCCFLRCNLGRYFHTLYKSARQRGFRRNLAGTVYRKRFTCIKPLKK